MKTRRKKKAKPIRRKQPTAQRGRDSSAANLKEQLDERTRERDEALERETAISEILHVISTVPGNLESVFRTILEHATRICAAKHSMLYRYDGEAFHVLASHGIVSEYAQFVQREPIHVSGREIAIAQVARTKQTVQIDDWRKSVAYAQRDPLAIAVIKAGYRTSLAVPMIKDEELIGAIVISRQEVHPFSEKQIELVTSFTRQAVIAIENARLLNELRQRTDDLSESLEQQTATSDVLRVISASPGELTPVFGAILENSTRICEAGFASLLLIENNKFHAVALHNPPREFADWAARDGTMSNNFDIPLVRLIRTRQTVHVNDITKEPAYAAGAPSLVALADLGRARTLLTVPMLKENELVGAIAIYRREVRSFTDKQIELVKNFAAQAVIAIENARLLNELRESLQQQTATADVLKVISSSPTDIQPVLDAVGENAARLCEANNAVIFRLEGGLLRHVADYGQFPTTSHPIQGLPVNRDTVTGRAVFERRTIHIHDLSTADEEFPEGSRHARRDGHRTTLATPLLREGVPVGAILIRRVEVRPFS